MWLLHVLLQLQEQNVVVSKTGVQSRLSLMSVIMTGKFFLQLVWQFCCTLIVIVCSP